MSAKLLLSLSLFCILLNGSFASSQEKKINKIFLDQYKPGMEKLVSFYDKVVIKARRTEQGFPNREKETVEDVFYMSNGLLQRLDIVNYSQKNDIPPNTKNIWVANPRASFTLRKLPDKDFVITGLEGRYEKQKQNIRLKGVVPFCSYCFFELTIPEFVQRREFDFKVTKVATEGLRTIVGYERIIPANPSYNVLQPIEQVGELQFLPNNFWALKEYSFGTVKLPSAARGKIKYELGNDNLPIIKQFETWREGKDGKRSQIVTIDVIECIFKDVDKKEFELVNFGLPDVKLNRTRTTPWHLRLALVGIICLGLAVLFRWLARRAKNKAAP